MRLALLCLVLVACPKGRQATFDPNLPEHVDIVTAADPLEVLRSGADSADPTPRARALALLAASGPDWDDEGLSDASPWVQRAVIEAVADRGDGAGRSALEALATREDLDPIVRGLAAVRGEASAPGWQDAHEPWVVAPLALAAMAHGDDGAREALADALATGELPLEVELVLEVGRSGDPALLPALQRAQDRVEDELVLAVAAARLLLGDSTAEQVFRKAITDSDVERRLEALDYLVDIDAAAAEALLRKAAGQGPELVTWYAELALAARTGSDPDLFARALADADREVRVLGARFAGEAAAGGPANKKVVKAARKAIVDALADPDAPVRAEALRAVSRVGLEEARAAATALLGDEHQLVRIEAAGALLTLRG